VNCPACQTANRAGALRCKRCEETLPRTCAGCGERLLGDGELCINCRTERVPAALGADPSAAQDPDDEAELLEADALEEVAPDKGPRFVGRGAALAELTQIVEGVKARAELAFVALTGAPGVGKTRLARELERVLLVKQPSTRMLFSGCARPGAQPFAAFQQLLRERFTISAADSTGQAQRRIAQLVGELLPASRATEVTHLLAQLVRVPFADSVVVAPLEETPAQLEARTFLALRRLLAADAARAPLVLVFDDVESASAETINLIHYLAAGLAASPVTLLCIGRPTLFEAHPTFGEGDTALRTVELGPLAAAEARELFGELVRSELMRPGADDGAQLPAPTTLPEPIAEALERLQGVPRALTELARYLLEVGVLVPSAAGFACDRERLVATVLPDDFESLLAERLRALPAGERDLLEKAAACGEAFWLDAVVMLVRAAAVDPLYGPGNPDGPTLGEVAAAGDRTRAEVEAALEAMERRGLTIAQPHSSIPGEREYRFAYPPWRDVVYEGIASDARSRYHRLIAQWLELRPAGRGEEEQEEIARHLERAGDGDAAALRYRRAADAARARYYNNKALRLYDAALSCLGPHDLASRIHLWHDLGSVFHLKGEFDAALQAFERMLRLAWVVASRTKAAVAFNKMGRIYRHKGELQLALDYLERGRELFQQADDIRGIASSLDDIGQILWLLARYDEALDRSAAALEIKRRLGDKRAIAVSLVNIGNIERHRGLFKEAEACYREALDLRTALGEQLGIAQCRNQLGALAFQRGDFPKARQTWEKALAQAENMGALPLQGLLYSHLGDVARVEGHHAEARTHFEAAEALARELDDRVLLARAARSLGLIDLAGGDAGTALERCQLALEVANAAGIRVDIGRSLLALGEVHAATLFDESGGGRERAEEYFRRGVELFREIGNEADLALGLESFGKYRVERGDLDSGKQLLREAEGIFTRLGMRAGDALRRVIGEL
jgi:tetratricopeptide (TPR) repeat protein